MPKSDIIEVKANVADLQAQSLEKAIEEMRYTEIAKIANERFQHDLKVLRDYVVEGEVKLQITFSVKKDEETGEVNFTTEIKNIPVKLTIERNAQISSGGQLTLF
jgi:hypothetical protein